MRKYIHISAAGQLRPYHTSGMGHVYQQRYKRFPIQNDDHFFVVCRYVERNALRAGLVDRAEDWRWGSLWRWLQKPEPDPKLLSPWPIARLPRWVERVNEPLTEKELAAVRLSAQRGRPLGEKQWVESTARRLHLESTIRPRGRTRARAETIQRRLTPLNSLQTPFEFPALNSLQGHLLATPSFP